MRKEGTSTPSGAPAEFTQQGSAAEVIDMAFVQQRFELLTASESIESVESALESGVENWIDEYGELNALLIEHGLPPIASRFLALFHDVKAETEPEKVHDRLARLGEEEVNRRWKQFTLVVSVVRAHARKAQRSNVTEWMLGPKRGDVLSTRKKFGLAYGEKESVDWGDLKKDITLEQAGVWLLELVQKQEEEERPAFELIIEKEVDPSLLDRHFGEDGPRILYEMLPEELRGFVDTIRIGAAPMRRRDESGAVLSDYPPAYGQFNNETRELFLAITPHLRPSNIIELFIHEYSHALCSEDSKRGRAMRSRFVEAAADKPNQFSQYVQDNYSLLGTEQGLEEDFAVSMQFLFMAPDVLEEYGQERLEAIVEIFKKHFPNVKLLKLIERFHALSYEAQMRERKDLKLARDLIAKGGEDYLEVVGWFSALEWRPLSYVLATGPANEENHLFDRADGSRITEHFDAGGRLYESTQMFLGDDQLRLFYDPEHDEQGRLCGYHRELGGETSAYFQLHYDNEDNLPTKIDVYAGDQKIAWIEYDYSGEDVIERTYDSEIEGDFTEIHHKIHNGLLFRSSAMIAGELIFDRLSLFDEEEREETVRFLAADGSVLTNKTYEYDD
jgi:hypothetical protein